MTLEEYIKKKYNGNNSAFGRANGMSKQAVGQIVNKGIYHVIDGVLMIARRDVK